MILNKNPDYKFILQAINYRKKSVAPPIKVVIFTEFCFDFNSFVNLKF